MFCYFLGVALSLFDFFSDGLQIEKKGLKKLVLYALTFFLHYSLPIIILMLSLWLYLMQGFSAPFY